MNFGTAGAAAAAAVVVVVVVATAAVAGAAAGTADGSAVADEDDDDDDDDDDGCNTDALFVDSCGGSVAFAVVAVFEDDADGATATDADLSASAARVEEVEDDKLGRGSPGSVLTAKVGERAVKHTAILKNK